MSNEAGPSKRRRMLPTTVLEDTASEGSKSPGNDGVAVALPRIYEARASITGLQTRLLRNKNTTGDLIETIAPPGKHGAIEDKQFL
ncbi:hypothetical protein E4U13_000091 [Claviceps humidiphila]|uniref:Uncharacterized protein n=1 Tax=Claviceps humidiphila TaxID=1294629 RepID=A0A9P7TX61_9HYPO|nr:hypothetical protein E4U13_000091 [Claviceps humidiphila]